MPASELDDAATLHDGHHRAGSYDIDLLISCSQSVLRLTPAHLSHCDVIAAGQGLYYGLARSISDTVWVAARHALVSESKPAEMEQGSLLELTADNSIAPRQLKPIPPLRDLHGIALFKGALWATSSFDDVIGIHNLRTRAWVWWQPCPLALDAPKDRFHFNTLFCEEETVWVLAHRHGPSWLMAFPVQAALAGKTVAPTKTLKLGHQAHNIWRQADGELCTCSSIEGKLVGEHGWQLHTGGFPRGVAKVPGGWVVGVSELKERKERDFSDARLLLYDDAWQQTTEVILPKVGMVLDILPIPRSLTLPVVGVQPVVVD